MIYKYYIEERKKAKILSNGDWLSSLVQLSKLWTWGLEILNPNKWKRLWVSIILLNRVKNIICLRVMSNIQNECLQNREYTVPYNISYFLKALLRSTMI